MIQDGMALQKIKTDGPAVANKVLMQYYEATNDNRAVEVLKIISGICTKHRLTGQIRIGAVCGQWKMP